MYMKTCRLDGSKEKNELALQEVEKEAINHNLDHKQMIQLRLLSEELMGLQKGILKFNEGDFFVESDGSKYTIHLEANIKMGEELKDKFINASTENQNDAYKGFKGKLCYIADTMLTDSEGKTFSFSNQKDKQVVNAYERAWFFSVYRQENKEKGAWDELEQSILGKLADEIIIGIRQERIEILVVKSFSTN